MCRRSPRLIAPASTASAGPSPRKVRSKLALERHIAGGSSAAASGWRRRSTAQMALLALVGHRRLRRLLPANAAPERLCCGDFLVGGHHESSP